MQNAKVIHNLSVSRRKDILPEYLNNICNCGRVFQVYFWTILTKFVAVAQLACGQVGVSGQICLRPGGTPSCQNSRHFEASENSPQTQGSSGWHSGQMSKHVNE